MKETKEPLFVVWVIRRMEPYTDREYRKRSKFGGGDELNVYIVSLKCFEDVCGDMEEEETCLYPQDSLSWSKSTDRLTRENN